MSRSGVILTEQLSGDPIVVVTSLQDDSRAIHCVALPARAEEADQQIVAVETSAWYVIAGGCVHRSCSHANVLISDSSHDNGIGQLVAHLAAHHGLIDHLEHCCKVVWKGIHHVPVSFH